MIHKDEFKEKLEALNPARYKAKLEELTPVRYALYSVTLLSLVLLIGIPVVFFMWGSIWSEPPGMGGHFTLAGYESLFNDAVYQTFLNTIIVAVTSTAVAMVLGIGALVVATKTNIFGGRLIAYILIIQYLIPSYILAVGWDIYLGSNSFVNEALTILPFISVPPFDIYTVWGIAIVNGSNYAGLVYLLTSGALTSGSAHFEEAAKISGASNFDILRKISLRLIMPSLLIAFIIVLIRTASLFGVPLILGIPGDVYVVATHMFVAVNSFPPNFAFASAIGMVILGTSFLGLYLQRRVVGERQKYATISGKGHQQHLVFNLGSKRYALGIATLAVLILIYLIPFIAIVALSFQRGFSGLNFFDATWTLENYTELFFGSQAQTFYTSFGNSIVIGLVGALVAMILSSLASYFITKSDTRISGFIDFLTLAPAALPSIVTGTAFLWIYLSHASGLYGTLSSIVVALIAQFLVYGARATNASFTAIDDSLEEAAEMSGASFFSTLRKIYAPLIMPGFMAGYVLLFVDFIKVLTIPLLLAGKNNQVLSSMLWQAGVNNDIQLGAAIAVVMIVTIGLIYAVIEMFTDLDVTQI